jgi:hypothetical protein
VIPATGNVGRARRYCRRSHRQRAYEARRLAGERQIHPDEVLVLRSTWDGLRDALAELQQASRAIAVDRGASPTPTAASRGDAGCIEAVARLSNAIIDLQELAVEPTARW